MSVYEDFVAFSKLQISSGDVDPAGPVLKYLYEKHDLPEERQMWFTLIYVAFYDMASGSYAYFNDGLTTWDRLPKGLDRRCLRPSGFMEEHLASYGELIKKYGSIKEWLTEPFTGGPMTDWHILRGRLQMVKYNGRWATYKLAKMFRKLHGLPVEVPDLGHKGSSGPRLGLGLLWDAIGCAEEIPEGNDDWDIELLDQVSITLLYKLKKDGLDIDMGALETLLCNFSGLTKGRFYVGRNIDRMQSQVLDSPVREYVDEEIGVAREKVLNHGYLGEIQGWNGIRGHLEKGYKETRVVEDTKGKNW